MKTENESGEYLDNLRHSTAHLLAAAVMELWPNTKRTIGPAIENGFYFDFDFGKVKINDEDLPKIEKKMRQILSSWRGFERHELNVTDAKKEYPGNEFKVELIDEFTKDGQKISFYKSGTYWDLCRGGHVENPSKALKHFKLLSLAGAYWRGDEKNKMLTRIYGTAFPTKEELDKYLWQTEEAKKRDHKKLGPQLDLFMFDQTAPGMPYWLPKGVIILNELINFWRVEHSKRGYQEIKTPLINKKELYETSGHWDHYKEFMFISETPEKETYGLKPMNCPNAMVVFGKKSRSYRELPLRLSDTDTLHRYERSGTLNGLFRVREFSQDDAHIFVTEEQIKAEYQNIFEITDLFYSVFNMEYSFRLGTRPEKFMGEVKIWDKAEKELKQILDDSGKKYSVLEGDGAFYGPKIDIMMKDSLGREWQMGTIQLDFQIPKRFELTYQAADGTLKTPAVIHRVIYGSLERFIGILIEHTAGNFPDWLSPIQLTLVPIAERHNQQAKKVAKLLIEKRVRVTVDDRSERMQARIRDATLQKVPYIGIIGDKEAQKTVLSFSLRNNKGEDKGIIIIDEFISKILKKAISTKR